MYILYKMAKRHSVHRRRARVARATLKRSARRAASAARAAASSLKQAAHAAQAAAQTGGFSMTQSEGLEGGRRRRHHHRRRHCKTKRHSRRR